MIETSPFIRSFNATSAAIPRSTGSRTRGVVGAGKQVFERTGSGFARPWGIVILGDPSEFLKDRFRDDELRAGNAVANRGKGVQHIGSALFLVEEDV